MSDAAKADADANADAAFSNPFSLAGRRIMVTGASSGIGRQIALSCAQMGAELVITGRDEARLADTLASLPGAGHRAAVADLTVQAQRETLVDDMGAIDGLVNNAGTSKLSPIRQAGPKHLHELWQLNYEAPILLTQRVLAKSLLRNDGSIIFTASIAAYIGVAGVGVYAGTKAALIATARSLATELARRRIRVNCLAPGLVESPLLEAAGSVLASLDAERAAYPLGFGKPEDVANAAVFFLSPASRWITGSTLVMDGGLTLT